MKSVYRLLVSLVVLLPFPVCGKIQVGADLLFQKTELIKGKKIGLITNQTAINCQFQTTLDLLRAKQKELNYRIVSLFAPEHGFYGDAYAWEQVEDRSLDDIPLFSLYGKFHRPTDEMLAGIDLLIYDIQDLGSRSYTFISTLFYCMEEAAKKNIPFIVLDRPNPMGGLVVDGPALHPEWRSYMGYVNVPYCHGMTVGELANFFNNEYNVNCRLTVIAMEGWKRGMPFSETGLAWVPTSPQIPEWDTPFFYPATGLIGHCSIASIGIGYTLPFKVIGAPWIDAIALSKALNEQKLPGVFFQPFFFRPFFGKFKLERCQGVKMIVTDHSSFLPVTTQFTVMGILKNFYPDHFDAALKKMSSSRNKRDLFNKLNGSEEVLKILCDEKYVIWKLREICQRDRDKFLPIRKKYLIEEYS